MKENLTREEKRIIVREHNHKVTVARIMQVIAFVLPVAVILNADKISNTYRDYLFYGSMIIAFLPTIRLIALSACPFCGHRIHGFWSRSWHNTHFCSNCKEKIR